MANLTEEKVLERNRYYGTYEGADFVFTVVKNYSKRSYFDNDEEQPEFPYYQYNLEWIGEERPNDANEAFEAILGWYEAEEE